MFSAYLDISWFPNERLLQAYLDILHRRARTPFDPLEDMGPARSARGLREIQE